MTAASAPPRRRGYDWGHLAWGAALVAFGVAWMLDASGVSVSYPVVTAALLIAVGLALPAAPAGDRGGLFGLGVLLAVVVLFSTLVGPAVPSLMERGIGEQVVRPTAATLVQDRYEHGVGDLLVDLRSITPVADGTDVAVQLAVGTLTVRVPAEVTVEVEGDVGLGEIAVFGREQGGFGPSVDERVVGSEGAPTLRLALSVGVGRIEVTR